MSASSPAQRVSVDVLPPLPADVAAEPTAPPPSGAPLSGLKTFYHPASGVAILVIDLLCFGPEVILPFSLLVLCPLAFLATFFLVYFFQVKWAREKKSIALGKAFLGAVLAGMPYPLAGSMLGAGVIALSGLPHHPLEALKKIPGAWSRLSR